jgi:alpha-tubulin suppressor-like RCC1 family protein
MAIRENGTLWAWGSNSDGQLGDGTATTVDSWNRVTDNDRHSPVLILDDVIAVSAGDSHSMAIRRDRSLWAWGENSSGQIGDSTTTSRHSPVRIMDDVVAISAGVHHSMAIKGDGTLWVWGENRRGELGDGTTTAHYSPVQILDDVIAISAGNHHSVAIRTDGSLWAWGENFEGQIGNGTTTRQLSPIKIMDNVIAISASGSHTMAIKADSSLWAWGENLEGQIGDGTTGNFRNSPVHIMDNIMLPNNNNATPSTPPTRLPQTAVPSSHSVRIDGQIVAFRAFNIEGSNYFMLRDVAFALNGSARQFAVGWDGNLNAINIITGSPYIVVGGEMATGGGTATEALPTTASVFVNGQAVNLRAYNIGGNNFFMLRDLSTALGFGVDWDAENSTVLINTN